MTEQNFSPISGMVITARNVSKFFGKEIAVNKLNFTIPQGKIIGLIGPSGCGKTTTVRLLTGIYRPSEGEIQVLGGDPRHFTARQRERIGYMTQLFTLFPDLTVRENMDFASSIYGKGLIRRQKRIKTLLNFVELTENRNKLTRNLSGGMQRRLALAATLAHDPDLIFLDEPTAGIDPMLRRKFWDHFIELKSQGKTLLITTQYVSEASYCDYVGVMDAGRLIMLEPADQLRQIAFGGEVLDLVTTTSLASQDLDVMQTLPFIRGEINQTGRASYQLTVDEASRSLPQLMSWLNDKGITVEKLEPCLPPYDDVFVKVIQDYREKRASNAEETGRES
jgi:ABC-2 type transport system ATP-binding protein